MIKNKRFLLYLVLSFVTIISVTFYIGRFWVEIYEKKKEKEELKVLLVKLKEKEESLKVDANKLQDPDYVARYAREKYLYSKEGEYIIKIPEE